MPPAFFPGRGPGQRLLVFRAGYPSGAGGAMADYTDRDLGRAQRIVNALFEGERRADALFLDRYRTLCLAPPLQVRDVFERIEALRPAAVTPGRLLPII